MRGVEGFASDNGHVVGKALIRGYSALDVGRWAEAKAAFEAALAETETAEGSFGLSAAETEHYHRAIWAALHGFVTLRTAGLMTRAASTDRSFTTMVDAFVDALIGR